MTEIPNTMRAMVLTGHGDLDKLEFHEQLAHARTCLARGVD